MTGGGRLRAFLAVPSDPDWVESARELVARIRPLLPEASWTRPTSWHLTVKFLGEISADAVKAFAERLAPRISERSAGELAAAGPVVFPPRGAARVLGVGFGPSDGFAEIRILAADAEGVARRVGAEREDRPFRPHVTFARLRQPWPRAAVATYESEVGGWAFPLWPVRGCVLYSSRLAPAGAVHTPLVEWAFAGSVPKVGA